MNTGGEYFLQEKYSEHYLSQYYGVDKDNVMIMKNHESDTKEEDFAIYEEFYKYICDTDMSISANYEKACSMMDINSFIDMICTNVYFCNMDFSYYKNWMCWRTRDILDDFYSDGRWRFMMYDCDALGWGANLANYCKVDSSVAGINSFTCKMPFINTSVASEPFTASLLRNETFKNQFIERFKELSNTNFSYEKINSSLVTYGMDMEFYETFLKDRAEFILEYLSDFSS